MLTATLALILAGAALTLLFEYDNPATLGPLGWPRKALPMNMSTRYARQEAGRKDSWGMVAKPAVRRVTDWNSAATGIMSS